MSVDEQTFRFGDFTLEAAEHRLLKGDREVPLRPKTFETLLHLVQHRGHAVRKADLLDAVWGETHVSEAVLTHCIAEVRDALEDDARQPRFVRTLPRLGYKFVAPVDTESPTGPAVPILQPRPGTEAPPAAAIAVLPFANLSADPENEYFCDGLSEELINGLTKVSGLHVVAHSSSFSFKGRNLDAREIGRQLNVGSILEGSVRKSGERLRISAQLIDTARGYHLWCEQYDRRLEDVFGIQDEISRAILGSLEVELARGPRPALVKRPTRNMDAYLLYLQGRAFWHRRFAGCLEEAVRCFEQAIEKDPDFALPYAGLADSLTSLGIWAFLPPRVVFPRAAALARKALDLDDTLAEAHASRAFADLFGDWAWDSAGRQLARAIELNPGSALIRVWNGHYLSIVGRMDEAIAEMELGRALDPLSPVVGANLGWTLYLARLQDRAIDELLKSLAFAPGNGLALFYLGFAYAEVGRRADALEAFRKAQDATGGMPWLAESIGMIHGLQGDRARALEILREAEARMATGYVPSSAIAIIHLGLGDDQAVMRWLARGVEEGDALLPWLKFMPAFDRLHSAPAFRDLLSRLGLAG